MTETTPGFTLAQVRRMQFDLMSPACVAMHAQLGNLLIPPARHAVEDATALDRSLLWVDSSSNNGVPDLDAYAAAGHKFAMFKATEGSGYEWSAGGGYHARAHALGMGVGRYYWPRPDGGPAKVQAEWFVRSVERNIDLKRDVLMPDIERSMDYATGHAVPEPVDSEWADFTATHMARVRQLLPGAHFVTYTGNWYVNGRPHLIAAIKEHSPGGVVLSDYDYATSAPANPNGFKIAAKQFTDRATVPGYVHPVDYNVWIHDPRVTPPAKDWFAMATPKDLQNAIAAANKELRGEIRADLERMLADSLVALRDGTEEGPFTIKRHPTFLRAGQSLKHLFGK